MYNIICCKMNFDLVIANKNKYPNQNSSFISQVDSRLKLALVVVFVVAVASAPAYGFLQLLPLILIPYIWLKIANINLLKIFRRLLLLSPFILFIGLFNLYFERQVFLNLGSINISFGMVSFVTILLKFTLSVSILILWMDSDGIFRICNALNKIGAPKIFTTQVFLMSRYIFLLVEIFQNKSLAYDLRAFNQYSKINKISILISGSMLGSIFLQVLHIAENIHQAMSCRGFNGNFVVRSQQIAISKKQILILILLIVFIVFCRIINLPMLFGIVMLKNL